MQENWNCFLCNEPCMAKTLRNGWQQRATYSNVIILYSIKASLFQNLYKFILQENMMPVIDSSKEENQTLKNWAVI